MKFARNWLALPLWGAIVAGSLSPMVRAESPTEGPAGNSLGRRIENFTLQDFRGKAWNLTDFDEARVVAVLFMGTECPIVRLYAPRLNELHAKYQAQGVQFVAINANQQDSLTELAHFARVQKIEFPTLKDPGNVVADQFGASRTPEVFVLDKDRRVRYQGRIDDQYTYGVQKPKVEHEYLTEAIDALLAGQVVATPHAEAVGCLIGRVFKEQSDSEVTYSRQISRILQARCVECHRAGEIGPFSLTDYDEVVGWAEMIAEVVREQRMPPWHADAPRGHFVNDARLTDEEKELIYRWVRAGAPEGDPAEAPPPREFVEGWRIGEPDLIVKMADKPFQVPAEGEVKYQHFVVDPGFTEDKWIQAAECRPGNRAVVHHIIVAALAPGGKKNAAHGELGSEWLTATAPGAKPLILPEGLAKFVPAGARLVFQLHYTPNGTPQEDLSSVGFIFADPAKVKKEVVTQDAVNRGFRIPPGAANHRVEATHTFSRDSLMLAMFPHMHLRGKSFQYTAIYPDGTSEVLLNVPRYDFNWQNSYVFPQPKRMPAGTKLHCVAYFDNSEDNLANPDPTEEVRWGDQTWEEMMIGYFDMTLADQDLTARKSASRTDTFREAAQKGEAVVDDELKRLAAEALASDESFRAFAVRVQKLVPQLDRVCLSVVRDDKLVIARAAQDPGFKRMAGGQGLSVPAAGLALAGYAVAATSSVNQDLSQATAPDLRFLRVAFSSSMHAPLAFEGKPATFNFWSSEKNAFPAEAVEVLTQLAAEAAKAAP